MFFTALRRAVRRPVRLLTSADQCRSAVARLVSAGHDSIGVDCEGSSHGRFGRLALLQVATETEILLVDVAAGGPAIVEPLGDLFGAEEPVKVFHDCREDASALLNQHGIGLNSVFDTQVGHTVWLERQNLEPYQASIGEVLRTFLLGAYIEHQWSDLEKSAIVPHVWDQRPLDPKAIRYAIEGVAHLASLRRAICHELGDPNGDLVLRRSAKYVEYAHINRSELPSADSSALRPGLPLKAMLVTRRPDSLYFKLNHSPLTGAALDPRDRREFADVALGDVVSCRAKLVSDCGQFVHLQREGHGRLFYDYGSQEMWTLPSQEEASAARPQRASTLYDFGKSGGPAMKEVPNTYREKRPEMIYKLGKRGQTKVRRTGFQPPKKPQGSAEDAGDAFWNVRRRS